MFRPKGREHWLVRAQVIRTKFARVVWRKIKGGQRFVQLA
jgi:hypothetical protein